MITAGSLQTHSIVPVGDQDWVRFTLNATSEVVIMAGNPSVDPMDLSITLHNAGLAQIDNDFNEGIISKIDRICGSDALVPGTYYVKVFGYYSDRQIAAYELALTATGCGTTGGSAVINEVDVGNPDWVELRNPGSQTVNLIGWHLVAYNSSGGVLTDYTLPAINLAGGAYLTIHENSGTNSGSHVYMGDSLNWTNGGSGAVALKNSGGTGVDFVRWGSSSVAPPSGTTWTGGNPSSPASGSSLARVSSGADTDSASDWSALSPTPGGANGMSEWVYVPIILRQWR